MSTNLITLMLSRRVAAMGLIGCLMLALLPLGCGGVEHALPRVQYWTHGPQLPTITEERLQGCVKDYANQLAQQSYRVEAKVQVDEKRRNGKIEVNGIPRNAPDFAACVRITLREMTVPGEVFDLRRNTPPVSTNKPTIPAGNAIANPLIVGALILFGELAIEAGGFTILFAISVELVDEAITDIEKALREEEENKNQCNTELTACLLTPLADLDGDIHGSSRCVMCWRGCIANNGLWPYRMMKGTRWATCEYRKK